MPNPNPTFASSLLRASSKAVRDDHAHPEHLRSLAKAYEALAKKWQQKPTRELWGDQYAQAMAEQCQQVADTAQTQLLLLTDEQDG